MSNYKNITESGIVVRGEGKLKNLVINSHSSGTVKIFDGTEGGANSTSTLTSTGALAAASHPVSVLTSSGAMVAGTHPVSVLTGDAIVAGNVVVIGSRTYTFKEIPDTSADEIALGASTEEALSNLYSAINGNYGSVAVNTQVVAVAKDATTVTVRGRVPGTSLNTVATTGTALRTVWADTTLGGGTGASDAGVTTGAATVTIGDITYTVVDALSETYGASAVAYQVLKGANEAAMIANLKKAINLTGTAGTEYSTGTAIHPQVRCTASDATTLTVKGIVVGTSLNTVATTETMANTGWADTTLGGGTGSSDAGIDTATATITIGTRTYTFVTELTETILGNTTGAVADQIYYVTSVAVALDNMKKAINASGLAGTDYSTGTTANLDVVATTNTDTTQVIVSKLTGTVANAIATTETIANHAWTGLVMASGTGATGSVLANTITFSAVATTGERFIDFGDAEFTRGLYVTIGGTADITLSYE